mmetsp:Transcript_9694/g.17638  ORF Transcript_9694/g.17638 Transcript_9694/m.17638 type:complete len:270 (-) Transcript_9694:120-929(-)
MMEIPILVIHASSNNSSRAKLIGGNTVILKDPSMAKIHRRRNSRKDNCSIPISNSNTIITIRTTALTSRPTCSRSHSFILPVLWMPILSGNYQGNTIKFHMQLDKTNSSNSSTSTRSNCPDHSADWPTSQTKTPSINIAKAKKSLHRWLPTAIAPIAPSRALIDLSLFTTMSSIIRGGIIIMMMIPVTFWILWKILLKMKVLMVHRQIRLVLHYHHRNIPRTKKLHHHLPLEPEIPWSLLPTTTINLRAWTSNKSILPTTFFLHLNPRG